MGSSIGVRHERQEVSHSFINWKYYGGLPVETSPLTSRNADKTNSYINWKYYGGLPVETHEIIPIKTRSCGILPGKKSVKRNKPSKMAAKNLTQEFHDMSFSDNYAMTMELPGTSECINSSELYHLRKYTTKTCNLVTSLLIDKKGKPYQVVSFNYLPLRSGKSSGNIRDDLLSWSSECEEEVCNLVKDYFIQEKQNFTSWYIKTSNSNNAVDELSLFLLGKQYTRHLILVNRKSYWSTLNSEWIWCLCKVWHRTGASRCL